MKLRATTAAVAALVLLPPPSSAQTGSGSASATFGEHLGVLSANAVVGGITGAVRALITGEDVRRTASRGLIGGAAVYAGKAVATGDWDGAALTGRVIAGFGSDIVRAATDSAPLLSHLELAIGPLRFRPAPVPGVPRLRVNLLQSAMLIRALAEPSMRLDWGRSLGSGTAIFATHRALLIDDGEIVNGIAVEGFVVLQDRAGRLMDQTFKHEMVHVLQADFLERAWGDPVESALRQSHPWARWAPSWIQAGVTVPALFTILDLFLNDQQGLRGLMQEEAEWFETR